MNRIAYVLAISLVCAAPVAAQTRPLTYDDYYRIVRVGPAALSPDGRRVAFVESRVDEEENRNRSTLHLVRADGSSRPTLLTRSDDVDETGPQWSPDGALLAFSRRGGDQGNGASSTWFLRTDDPTGPAFQIDGLEGSPIFDPTNRRIAFTRPVPPEGPGPPEPELTEEERRIVERFDGRAYDWMQFRFDRRGYLPDPTDPHATPPSQIFALPRDGGEARQLTDLDVDASDVSWRPDGEALAFTADEHQRDEHTYPRADLWTVDLQGEVTRLTDDEYDWSDPTWSPNGRHLVARGVVGLDVIIRERWDHGSPTDLWLFTADGATRRNLTSDFDLIPGTPTWSADGSTLYFTAAVGGDSHLFRLDVQDGSIEQMTDGEGRGTVAVAEVHARQRPAVERRVGGHHHFDQPGVRPRQVAVAQLSALDREPRLGERFHGLER
ncbi:MAG: hypothetical protein R3253_02410, partial [Longimicrobiales bacterium]|nr:hypothetical protein [Longimicrobiales bacterium]